MCRRVAVGMLFCVLGGFGAAWATTAPASHTPPSPAAAAAKDVLPVNTSLVLQLDDEVSTGSAKVGDAFRAHLENAIILAGKTIAAAGASVLGHVTFVSHASAPDHDGYLSVRFDPLPLNNGELLPLRPLNSTWSIHVTAGQQSTSDVTNTLEDIFIPYHFLYRQFRKGSNLDLKPGTTVHAVTMGTVRMVADVPRVEAIAPLHLGTAVPYATVTPIPLFTPAPLVKSTPTPRPMPNASPTPTSPAPSPGLTFSP